MSEMLDAALGYARRGWLVFPLKVNGKKPLTPNGVYDATINEAQIRQWWTDNPRANIATPTGVMLRNVVIRRAVVDVESPEGHDGVNGFEGCKRLAEAHKDIPPSFAWDTWSGGMGIMLAIPDDVTDTQTVNIEAGVAIRASDGHYVVLPPSHVEQWKNGELKKGDYRIKTNGELRKLPEWAIEAATKKSTKLRNYTNAALPEVATPGQRHDSITSLVGSMIRRKLPEAAALDAALAYNARQCQPPKDESAVRATVADLYHRYDEPTPAVSTLTRGDKALLKIAVKEDAVFAFLYNDITIKSDDTTNSLEDSFITLHSSSETVSVQALGCNTALRCNDAMSIYIPIQGSRTS